MSRVKTFEELKRIGGEFTRAGDVVLFNFSCPGCGEDVTIEEANFLPETATHGIASCMATLNVREAGGWWTVFEFSDSAEEGTVH